jgi:hypothetical protein
VKRKLKRKEFKTKNKEIDRYKNTYEKNEEY